MTSEPHAPADPGFGQSFTDHLVVAHHRDGAWSEPELVAFGDLTFSPAAMALHYGQSIFEGLKAFRQPDGTVALFRPDENAARFDRSAARMAMPALPDGTFVRACLDLVTADDRFVPDGAGHSLYLRPVMMATEAALGVRPANEYLFTVLASPAGSYFPHGVTPITVWVADRFVRAVPGGTGAVKCAGNYAASLAAKAEAARQGCDEALWLDAVERRWIEELSGMNVVFVERSGSGVALVTPPAEGTILDGVTRKSILDLAVRAGIGAVERPIAIDEVIDGRLVEAFACGTAAVIVPIGGVVSGGRTTAVAGGEPGPTTLALRQQLVDLQQGRVPDPFGWLHPVSAAAARTA